MEKALEPKNIRDRGTSKRPSCTECRWHLPHDVQL